MKTLSLFAAALFAAIATLAVPTVAAAHEFKLGDLVIHHPHMKGTPPNAPVSGGYLTIENTGSEADRLVSADTGFAGQTQIHEMSMEGDVMKMRELPDGLEIPAGGSVELKPGGYHVMFMQLKEQMKPGEMRKAILTFEKAGQIEVEFKVDDMSGAGTDHSTMKMGNGG
ncbi:hypothetical protein DFR52_102707 [Hoeflea marina]|uniref:Copper(I)-binding protein n=1 Tax=Hoeflea marina TaxID=274592 RepID=A0A317PMC5_9HYPH|nr:copper chaperone PCu(A)C [Hoeflea marina]PWW02042.1 hypothetical protein DFR52_102707 [Hoeflea marina]